MHKAFCFMENFGHCRKSLPFIQRQHSSPGAAEVEVTMQQQSSTHLKINLAHLLHLDNE